MHSVTHIRSDEARRVHAALVAALGTETNPAQWMTFMRTVREQLPTVLSKGRPTKQAIEASTIGALGFSSWKAMCEAPVVEGGLGLPWSTWRQWSRAWSVVQQRPNLEGAPLTAAEVNRIAAEAKSAGEPMPADKTAVEAFRKRQNERKSLAKAEMHSALKSRLEALQADLEAGRKEIAQTNGVITELRRQLVQVEKQLADEQKHRNHAEWQMVQLEAQNKRLQERNQEIEGDLQMYQGRGFLQRLRDVFTQK